MRLGELLGRRVVDPTGRELGAVRDVRLVADGPAQAPTGSAAYRVDGLVVGTAWSMARLGYAYGEVRGPWLLAVVLRALGRPLRYVPWEAVRSLAEGQVVVDGQGFSHPRELASPGAVAGTEAR